jgi:hypothetical protein
VRYRFRYDEADRDSDNARDDRGRLCGRKKKKSAWGVSEPFEKARFGRDNPRKSKPFPLIFFAPAWLGFAGFGQIWNFLGESSTYA